MRTSRSMRSVNACFDNADGVALLLDSVGLPWLGTLSGFSVFSDSAER